MNGDKMKGWKQVVRSGEAEYQTAMRSKRLRRLLADVWNGLPKDDRLQINDSLIAVSDASILTVVLNDSGAEMDGMYGCAVPTWNGRRFVYLSAARMAHKSDGFISYVIAHELAHVFHRHGDKGTTRSKKRMEAEADATAARWKHPDPRKPEENMKPTFRSGRKLPKGIRK
jgi:hypothetical protein